MTLIKRRLDGFIRTKPALIRGFLRQAALHLIVVGISPAYGGSPPAVGLTPIFMGNFGRRRAQNCPSPMPPDDASALALRGQ